MRRVAERRLGAQPFDLLVVGAGVNGAGVARDAALRGLRVLLVDQEDCGAGTTSWSTRLVHGGLRYLQHGEVGLVRESLRERERLLRLAPHLVAPLPFLIPVYRGRGRGRLTIRAGMLAYDALALDGSLPRHRMLDHAGALAHEPGLEREGLRGAALYHDAQVAFPERLAVETALAAHDAGAVVLTHTRMQRLLCEEGRVVGAELRDALGGEVAVARAAVTANVTGPWVDVTLGSTAGLPERRLVGGTKGSHLVVAPFPGAPRHALYVEAGDGRPFFVVPWNGLLLVGTTDTRYAGDLDDVEADEREIAYLLDETNRVLPAAGLRRDDVLYTYAGVRPLPEHQQGDEGAITRRHVVHDHAPVLDGLISVVGGKLTTFRELARQVVDLAVRKLGRPARRPRTADLPLPGGAGADPSGFARDFLAAHAHALPEGTADRLLRLYGTRADDVLAVAAEEPALAEVLDPSSGALRAEVVHAVRSELAVTLDDVLMRRTMLGLGASAGVGPDRAAAEVAVAHLGWSCERAAAEVERHRERVRRSHARSAPAA